jgi:hypothetical protein
VFDFVRNQVDFRLGGLSLTPTLPAFRTLLFLMD